MDIIRAKKGREKEEAFLESTEPPSTSPPSLRGWRRDPCGKWTRKMGRN